MKGWQNSPLAEVKGRIAFGVVGVVAVMALVVTLLYASSAWAKTLAVTNTHNAGAGSLRAAINEANSLEGADRIVFADGVSGTITLVATLPTIRDAAGLTIDGGGDVAVSGNDAVGVFVMSPTAELSLRNLTVSDGVAEVGGGVFNGGGTLNVDGSTFSGNEGDFYGGGIFNDDGGTLTVSESTFSGNWASDYGGGVFNGQGAEFTLSDSTFSGNETADIGAGIANLSGTVVVTGSTFSGNSADFTGGGIATEEGMLKVTNSTFSGNDGSLAGGGINSYGGPLEVVNSTFSGNRAYDGGGGIAASSFSGGPATLRSTIVVNNPIGDICSGTIIDGGHNIDDDGTCGFTGATGSLPSTDPLLDPDGLQDNGGPTKTIALRPASPAINAIPQGTNGCATDISTDQRGVKRPQGGKCEIGSFEDVSPKVRSVVPKEDATGVGTATNVVAFFSEAMRSRSIDEETFVLFRAGTTTPLVARVDYDPTTKKALLNPEVNLQSGRRYKAVVGTGAKDLAGNSLDQDRYPTNGEQNKVWFFEIKN